MSTKQEPAVVSSVSLHLQSLGSPAAFISDVLYVRNIGGQSIWRMKTFSS